MTFLHPALLHLVSACCFAVASILGFRAYARARSRALADALARSTAAGDLAKPPRSLWRLLLGSLASRLRPDNQLGLEQLSTQLAHAGRRNREEVDRFLEEKVLGMLLGLGVGLALAAAIGGAGGFLLLVLSLLVGILAPAQLVSGRAEERQGAISRGLPSAVDLLVTCLDAGLALDHAVARVAKELALSEPVLADELRITSSELDAGVALSDALRRLARRVGLDELSAMCGVIAQASALGAPIAQTLREYAVASRRQRLSMLEERAGRLATRLTLPLALCLLPAALMIILGPAAVQLFSALR